jgi:transcriptional regulator with GAF, ATPase, and Fis domain
MVERREFLEPLYYRLNVMCVESARVLPPASHRSASAP